MDILLGNGADVNDYDEDGLTPLHFAVRKKHRCTPEIVRFLIGIAEILLRFFSCCCRASGSLYCHVEPFANETMYLAVLEFCFLTSHDDCEPIVSIIEKETLPAR